MTETGAGERARELAAAAYKEWDERGNLDSGDLVEVIARHLAGALAAVRLEEARWWEHLIGDCHGTELASECVYCERILALERAVEGK